MIKIKMK